MRNFIVILFVLSTNHTVFCQRDLKTFLELHCPDTIPEVFLKGIVSDKHHEHSSPTFDFENNIIYWTTVIDSTKRHTILQTSYNNGEFTPHTIAPFSGNYKDFNFILSDRTNFLSSKRPRHDNSEIEVGLWTINKNGNTWEEPSPFYFKKDSNSYGYRLSSFNSDKNRLYFGTKYSDIIKDEFNYPTEIENINQILSDKQDWMFFMSYDESYIIFSSNREGGYGSFDLYISFKTDENDWTIPLNMGNKINTKHQERCPGVTDDDKYFFFTRPNPPNRDDIWWVSAKIIDELKKKK